MEAFTGPEFHTECNPTSTSSDPGVIYYHHSRVVAWIMVSGLLLQPLLGRIGTTWESQHYRMQDARTGTHSIAAPYYSNEKKCQQQYCPINTLTKTAGLSSLIKKPISRLLVQG
jgi:hypothetical protein